MNKLNLSSAKETTAPPNPQPLPKSNESPKPERVKEVAPTSADHQQQPRVTGFDAVVKEERAKRALTFGPSAVKVSKPSNILIDIYGVICSWQFAHTLTEYAKANLGKHVKESWSERTMKLMMARMREQVFIDRYAGDQVPPIAPENAPLEEQKETAAVSIQWQMEHNHPTTKV